MNSSNLTQAERAHMALVKQLSCSVCNVPGPSECHHINQGQHMTVVALCRDCHQGSRNGWHGGKGMWRVRKLDEMGALNITLRRLAEARR